MAYARRSTSQYENRITEGVIWKVLLSFFFPILLGTFFQQMYNTVDAIVVGQFAGKEALAAVGSTATVLVKLIVGFFMGLSSGAAVVLSQFYGGRQSREVSETVHTAIALAIVGGLLIMVLGIALAPALLRLLNTPDEIMNQAVIYIRVYFAGMIPSLIYNIGSGLLRAVGDSFRPLLYLIVACVINIVLDLVFVAGMQMDVAGAALATIISQLVSAILILLTLMRSYDSYRLELRKIRFHSVHLRRIIAIGLPAGLQSMAYSVSNAIAQASINSFGTDVMAAFTVHDKIDAFNWMIQSAFGVSITTFVGQNFGAQKFDRMKQGVRICLVMTAGTVAALTAFMLFVGPTVFRLFTNDPQVLEIAQQLLWGITPFYLLYVCVEVFSGALRGTGDTLIPSLLTLGGVCLLRSCWVLIAVPMNRTLGMLLVCYPLTWGVTSLLFAVYYVRGSRLGRARQKAGLAEHS